MFWRGMPAPFSKGDARNTTCLTRRVGRPTLNHMVKYEGNALDATFAALADPTRRAILARLAGRDRKSTRLNSSHGYISYAVFCLKKKNTRQIIPSAPGLRGTRDPRATPHRRARVHQKAQVSLPPLVGIREAAR